MTRTLHSLLRLSVFLAVGYVAAIFWFGATIDAERATAEADLSALRGVLKQIETEKARHGARDLQDIALDATWRHRTSQAGFPNRLDARIAAGRENLSFEGHLTGARSEITTHGDRYGIFRLETDGGTEIFITPEPAILDAMLEIPIGSPIWLSGDERLRLRHGHAMAGSLARALEITRFRQPDVAPVEEHQVDEETAEPSHLPARAIHPVPVARPSTL